MSNFRVEHKDGSFLFPAFKFLKVKHRDALLADGNVRLATLHEFRDQAQYGGKIHDKGEGSVKLECRYSFFHGLAKDAHGLLAMTYPAYAPLTICNGVISQVYESENHYVYCLTRQFLSDSFRWAVAEGKETCVLIKDIDLFFSRVTRAIAKENSIFDGVDDCLYLSRHILDVDPTPNSVSNFILTSPWAIARIKPIDYAAQREIRAIWRMMNEKVTEALILNVPEVSELCIPVHYPKLTTKWLATNPECVGVRFVRRVGEPVTFLMKRPWEICSPIICKHSSDTDWMIGLHDDHGTINRTIIARVEGDVGAWFSPIGPIYNCTKLAEVTSIEYFVPTRKQVASVGHVPPATKNKKGNKKMSPAKRKKKS